MHRDQMHELGRGSFGEALDEPSDRLAEHESEPYPPAASGITARDLIAQGHKAGPKLGSILFQRRAESVRTIFQARR